MVGNGNGRVALLKEYGNLSMGSILLFMVGMCLYFGLQMGQRFLEGQMKLSEKMVENQRIEIEQDLEYYEQMRDHNDKSREILRRVTIGDSK